MSRLIQPALFSSARRHSSTTPALVAKVQRLASQRVGQSAQIRKVAHDILNLDSRKFPKTAIGHLFSTAQEDDGLGIWRNSAVHQIATLARQKGGREMRRIATRLESLDFNPFARFRPLLEFLEQVNPGNQSMGIMRAVAGTGRKITKITLPIRSVPDHLRPGGFGTQDCILKEKL